MLADRRYPNAPPGASSDEGAVVMEVDHEKQVVYTEPLVLSPRDAPSLLAAMQPSQENTAQRLTAPIVSTHLNTRNVAFERSARPKPPVQLVPLGPPSHRQHQLSLHLAAPFLAFRSPKCDTWYLVPF